MAIFQRYPGFGSMGSVPRNSLGEVLTRPASWQDYTRAHTAKGALQGNPQNIASLLAGVDTLQKGYQSYLQGGDARNAFLGLPSRTAPPANEFSLVDVNRDPSGSFDAIRTNLMNRIAGASPNYSGVRSASQGILASLGVGGGGGGGGTSDSKVAGFGVVGGRGPLGRLDALNASNAVVGTTPDESGVRAETDTFINNLRRLQPQLQLENATQSEALNRVFDPSGYQAELARNTQFAADAERRLANQAIQGALLQGRLGSAGGVGSSYVNAQVANATGRIGAETAARTADRRRQDTAALLAAQQQNFGRSQDLATRTAMLDQLPVDLRNAVLDNEMRRTLQQDTLANTEVQRALGRMSALGQAVNIDQATDELTTLGRQLGLSGQALQQFLASRIQGVRKEGEDYPLFVPGLPSRGGGPSPAYPNYSPPQGPSLLNRFGPGMGGAPTGRARSAAEESYFANAGVYPDRDPNFSQELWNYAQGAAQRAAYYGQPRGQYYDEPEGPLPQYSGSGYGAIGQPNGSYELIGNYDYSNPNNPAGLYVPGWDPAQGRDDYVSPYE